MQQVSVPVTVQQISSQGTPGTQPNYASSASKGLGITQIVIGICCILLHIVLISLHIGIYPVGHGIWCGAFFIVAGSFGVAAGKTKMTGFIITFMVLSIIAAALFATSLLTFAAIDINLYGPNYIFYYMGEVTIATEGLLCALAVLEGVIAIISSTICCRHLCCSSPTAGGQLHYGPAPSGQVVLTAGPPAGQPQYFFPSVHVAAAPQPAEHSGPFLEGIPAQLQPTAENTNQPPPAYSKTGDSA